MKNSARILGILVMVVIMASCGGAHGDNPGRAYMPDMYYSRAYETYGYNNIDDYQKLKEKGINYNAAPVPGTIARGDFASSFPYAANDSGYAQSAAYRSPMDTVTLSSTQMAEAERLYLVNCAICHGTKLDGNGPLWKGGDGPYPAAPRNLLDDYTKNLANGQLYHVITFGKGQMGSYASQLHPEQRWWVIHYIRNKQGGGASDTTVASSNGQTGTGASSAPAAGPAAATQAQ